MIVIPLGKMIVVAWDIDPYDEIDFPPSCVRVPLDVLARPAEVPEWLIERFGVPPLDWWPMAPAKAACPR